MRERRRLIQGLLLGFVFKFCDWGEIDYNLSVYRQQEIIKSVGHSGEEYLISCTHPPIVTLGRSSSQKDLIGWKGPIFQSQRGGKATYHGPSQVIIYPIIDLKKKREAFSLRDVHGYLRSLETWLVKSLKKLSIEAQPGYAQESYHIRGGLGEEKARGGKRIEGGRKEYSERGEKVHGEDNDEDGRGRVNLMTGVWVGDKKIASIGIAVRSWITYHGVALNLNKDLEGFRGIRPCGFESHVMTSIEEVLGKKLDRKLVVRVLKEQFYEYFQISAPS